MEYNAHKTKDGRIQSIKEHSENVSILSKNFSIGMFKSICNSIGMAHDIGKYSQKFQKRLNGSKIHFEHSLCGAIEYEKLITNVNDKQFILPIIQYCIACHHTGLQDGSRVKERLNDSIDSNDYSNYKTEIKLEIPQCKDMIEHLIFDTKGNIQEMIELYSFFTRYIFSCLTDADFLDTEKFSNPKIKRADFKTDFQTALRKVNEKLSSYCLDNPLRLARSRLQTQAFENAKCNNAINILEMPTGSGKTICSLKIALEKIVNSKSKKNRIIYVVPYTSIIEQTAKTFENIIGEDIDILQHHSNYEYENVKTENNDDISTQEKLKLACENWDAPFIITTNVQFFESLYHYRSSKLRKLHNLENSVIVFDEIHTLPIAHLQPCLKAIGYITKYLNSEVIFLSATMPNYADLFKKYFSDIKPFKLITNTEDFSYFQKCNYIDLKNVELESLILKAEEYQSSLIIVNKKKTAREIYDRIPSNRKKYHLSTYMTPVDRSYTINQIKEDLKNDEDIIVVSTSLVEAGVDFDFKSVFRELAGLDNILQSGGRCNREGSQLTGDVYIFQLDNSLPEDLKQRVNTTQRLLRQYENISSNECIKDYYRSIFNFNDDKIKYNSIAKDISNFKEIPFKTYAENFKFINDNAISVVINNDKNCDYLLNQLLEPTTDKKSIKRKLQKYVVSIRIDEYDKILNIIEDFNNMGIFILTDKKYYSSEKGLDIDYIEKDIIIYNINY